jgi:antitoxin component of RelBE/YafQ-DinJ toxin-antitoxin module
MTTKLTLRLDDTVIKKAKKSARTKGVSLSRMVEDYFKSVASQERLEVKESPVLYEIAGVLSGKQDAAEKNAEYRKHLAEKYR